MGGCFNLCHLMRTVGSTESTSLLGIAQGSSHGASAVPSAAPVHESQNWQAFDETASSDL